MIRKAIYENGKLTVWFDDSEEPFGSREFDGKTRDFLEFIEEHLSNYRSGPDLSRYLHANDRERLVAMRKARKSDLVSREEKAE